MPILHHSCPNRWCKQVQFGKRLLVWLAMASKCSNCVSETKIHPSLMCLTLHQVPFSLLRLRHLNLRTPVSPALPLNHICFMTSHNLHLQSLVLSFQWVLPNVLPLALLVIREVTESWDSWRHWGLKKLGVCVLHLAWKKGRGADKERGQG